MMTDYTRRATDQLPMDIESMILEENDSKRRAFLIVMNSININLSANTKTIKEISERLEEHIGHYENHVAEEAAVINRGKGAWKVIAWVIGVAQVVGVVVWQDIRGTVSNINDAIQRGEVQMAKVVTRVEQLENRIK